MAQIEVGKKRVSGGDTAGESSLTDGSDDLLAAKKLKVEKKHKPLPESKFGGMTEEEVCKLLLPDHMKPGLDVIFVRVKFSDENHNDSHSPIIPQP